MKDLDRELLVSRRQFVRQSACAALGIGGIVNTLAHLQLMNSALAQSGPLSDYKALVVLFEFGGNDSNNMLIPRMSHPGYADYKASRGILRILDSSDPAYVAGSPASIALSAGGYGVHPNMQPVADMFNAGRLAFVANVGTLAYPITRAQFLANPRTIPVPPQLFSHSDQQLQWQSSVPDRPFSTGWGGRVADLLSSTGYSGDQVSLSITLAGINSLQVGQETVQYSVNSAGAVPLTGYVSGTNPYGLALNPDGSYRTTTQGRRLKAFEDIMRYTHQHLLEEGYNEVVRRARNNEALVGAAFTEAAASGVNFDQIFTAANANTGLGTQLKTIARLIAGRNSIANRRQIFFCSAGGYDTHQNQGTAHGNLMRELANSLSAFNNALTALGVSENVLTLTHSDFTRTFTPNGTDAASGSDHGWGGHHLVMGGSVNGGQIYGQFPSLKVNADQDVSGNRGRWIPTTAVDQYAARSAGWLGVQSSAMEAIFPNLGRFADPFGSTANLGFI